MPEINRVRFQYNPVDGSLYLDHFRQNFYMERLPEVKDALQEACFVNDAVPKIEGEIRFSDAEGEDPVIRDVRYSSYHDRSEHGEPFDQDEIVVE